MTADDVAYAVEWQRRTGFRLDLAFNGAGSVAADAGRGHGPADRRAGRGEGRVRVDQPHLVAPLPGVRPRPSTDAVVVRHAADPGLDPLRQQREHRVGDHPQRRVRAAPRAADRPDGAGHRRARRAAGAAADARRQPAAGRGARGRRASARSRRTARMRGRPAAGRRRGDRAPAPHRPRLRHGDGRPRRSTSTTGCTPPAPTAATASARPTAAARSPQHPGTGFTDHIVPVEADKVLDHMLTNDPRPHYVHQPQLTEDRTLYPLLDRVIGDYRSLVRRHPAAGHPDDDPGRAGAGPPAAVGRGGRRRTGAGPGSRTARSRSWWTAPTSTVPLTSARLRSGRTARRSARRTGPGGRRGCR